MAADWLFGEEFDRDKVRIVNNAIRVEDYQYSDAYRKQIRRI